MPQSTCGDQRPTCRSRFPPPLHHVGPGTWTQVAKLSSYMPSGWFLHSFLLVVLESLNQKSSCAIIGSTTEVHPLPSRVTLF